MSAEPLAAARLADVSTSPRTTRRSPTTQLFLDSVVFTLKYTAIVTVLLSGIALLLALQIADPAAAASGSSGAPRTSCPAPSGSRPPRCCSTASTARAARSTRCSWISGSWTSRSPGSGRRTRRCSRTIAMVIWRFAGFNMLILLTGLQAIPTDVYEAARSDGASRWQTFRYITLPLLRPTIALMLVLSITGSLLAFDQFFILTRGGPDNSTVTHGDGHLPRGVHPVRPRLGGGDLGAPAARARRRSTCSSCAILREGAMKAGSLRQRRRARRAVRVPAALERLLVGQGRAGQRAGGAASASATTRAMAEYGEGVGDLPLQHGGRCR